MMMDIKNKPQSTPLKDWIVKQTASKLEIEESLCDTIIGWAYLKAKEATARHSIIELSGFGKIYAGPKKVERKLIATRGRIEFLQKELQESHLSEEGAREINNKIRQAEEYITYLESKTNEYKLEPSSRGMEE